MRKRSLFLMLVVLLVTMIPFAVSAKVTAQGVPATGPFKTTFRIQNLGAAIASCSYDVYTDAGAAVSPPASTSLPPIEVGASAMVAVESVDSFPTGTNAAVISCSEEVAVNVMFNDSAKTDSYNGISDPATVLWLPQVFRLNAMGYQSSVRIQNATASAATGTIEYIKGTTVVDSDTINLAGNGAITIDQKANAALAIGAAYAARITMDQPVAAIASIFGKVGTARENRLRTYEAFTGGTQDAVYAPVLMRNYSESKYDTIINVQNLGDAPVTVRIRYVSASVPLVKDYVVQPKASRSIKQDVETSLPSSKVFAAKIVPVVTAATPALQDIIVTVDEISELYSRDSTYKATASGGTKVAIPYVLRHYNKYNSSVTCQNVSNSVDDLITELTVTYHRVKNDGTIDTQSRVIDPTLDLKPGKTLMIYQGNETLLPYNINTATGSFAAMTVEVTGSSGPGLQEIACVVNVDQTDGTARTIQKDRLAAYNAVVMVP